jgi:hypothetical protein
MEERTVTRVGLAGAELMVVVQPAAIAGCKQPVAGCLESPATRKRRRSVPSH